MSEKSDELEHSPPLYYRLNLPVQSKFSVALSIASPSLKLALELVRYVAIKNTPPLIEVLDTLKAFSSMSYIAEFPDKEFSYADSFHLLRKIDLDSSSVDRAIRPYYLLTDHFYSYDPTPPHALSKPDAANILRYPNMRAVQDLWERNSTVPEVETALPILYILMKEVDKAIEVYKSKDTMNPYDYYNLGTIYLIEKDNVPRAREQLRKAATELSFAQYNLGMTYLYERDWEEAAKCFEPFTGLLLGQDYRYFVLAETISFADHVIAQFSCNNLGVCHYHSDSSIRDTLNCFEVAAACREFTGYDDGALNRSYLRTEMLEMIDGSANEEREGQDSHDMIGKSKAIHRVFDEIDAVADTDAEVLIIGGTGTGKELVAKAIHKISGRAGELIAVNCGRLEGETANSDLFGHDPAFTGIEEIRKGAFELADGSTLFLDEINSLDLRVQSKLLRAIEDKKFRRHGGEEEIKVDVRIICGVNRNLDEAVKEGIFREDLYYRIAVYVIEMPTLCERTEDIIPLAEHFLNEYAVKYSKRNLRIAPKAFEALQRYNWPGNVRQLENAIKQAVIRARGQRILVSHLPKEIWGNMKRVGSDIGQEDILTREEFTQILNASGLSQKKFGGCVGVSRVHISNIKNGRSGMSKALSDRIRKKFAHLIAV